MERGRGGQEKESISTELQMPILNFQTLHDGH